MALCDVVGGMGKQDHARPTLAGGVGNEAVSGPAGGGRQTRGRLWSGPGQTAPVGPRVACGGFCEGGPSGAVGTQPVIDGQGQQSPTAGPGPIGGDPQQGDRIAAARQGQGDRMIDVTFQPVGQAGQSRPGPVVSGLDQPGRRGGGVAAGAAAQPMRVRASVARVRRAGAAASA